MGYLVAVFFLYDYMYYEGKRKSKRRRGEGRNGEGKAKALYDTSIFRFTFLILFSVGMERRGGKGRKASV